jgi:hypothetical protein
MDSVNERVTSLQSDLKNMDKDKPTEWMNFVRENPMDGTLYYLYFCHTYHSFYTGTYPPPAENDESLEDGEAED